LIKIWEGNKAIIIGFVKTHSKKELSKNY